MVDKMISINPLGQPAFPKDEAIRDRWDQIQLSCTGHQENWTKSNVVLYLTKKRFVCVGNGSSQGQCFPIDATLMGIDKLREKRFLFGERTIGTLVQYKDSILHIKSKNIKTDRDIRHTLIEALDNFKQELAYLNEKKAKEAEFSKNAIYLNTIYNKIEEEGNESTQAVAEGFENFETMKKSLQALLKLARDLKAQQPNNTEADELMTEINDSSMYVSKKVSKDAFFFDLAKSINHFYCSKMKESDYGMEPMIDFFCDYNMSQGGTDVKTPLELLQTKQIMEEENMECRIRTINAMEVLVHVERAKAFENRIQELLHKEYKGYSVLQVAQHFNASLMLIRSILEQAEKDGILCREERPNGIFYWQNIFLI